MSYKVVYIIEIERLAIIWYELLDQYPAINWKPTLKSIKEIWPGAVHAKLDGQAFQVTENLKASSSAYTL
jgi:hypothetical protein